MTAKITGSSATAILKLTTAKLSSLVLNPTTLVGGATATGTVNLSGPAAVGGAKVTLKLSGVGATIPSAVTVPAGSSSATFPIQTQKVTVVDVVKITATEASASISAELAIDAVGLQGLSLSTSAVTGGTAVNGVVSLTGPAPAGGLTVSLSSNRSVATVPATVTVPYGSATANFTVNTTPDATKTLATVTASAGAASNSASLTVNSPVLGSVNLNPTSVAGGVSASGSVALNGPAPSGGYLISLKSSQSSVGVPTSVTVASGATSANFTVTSQAGLVQIVSTITATDPNSDSATGTITIDATSGLAATAWPKIHQNVFNSGIGSGKGGSGQLAWGIRALGYPTTGITVGPDGSLYFCTSRGYLCKFNQDGSEAWAVLNPGCAGVQPAVAANGICYFSGNAGMIALDSNGSKVWTASGGNNSLSIAADGTIVCASQSNVTSVSPNGNLNWNWNPGSVLSACTAANGTIYASVGDFTLGSGALVALSSQGSVQWSATTGGGINLTQTTTGSDGTIYTTAKWGGIERLMAFTPTGTHKWTFNTNGIIAGFVLGANGTVYLSSQDGLYSISSSGNENWLCSAAGTFNPEAPVLGQDGTAYVIAGSAVVAVNLDGSVKWTNSNLVQPQFCSMGLDGSLYVGGTGNFLTVLGPDNSTRWTAELSLSLTTSPSLAADGTLYGGANDGNLYAWNQDGTQKWIFPTGGPVKTTPAIGTDGTLYFGSDDGTFYAVSPSGAKVWSYETGGPIESSANIGPDRTVYFGSADQNLYAFAPGGTKVWAYAAGFAVNSSPAIGLDGKVYIANSTLKPVYGGITELVAVSPSGAQSWTKQVEFSGVNDAAGFADVVVSPDGSILVTNTNDIDAFHPDGSPIWETWISSFAVTVPAVGADGTIYVSDSTSKIYAVDPRSGSKSVFFAGQNPLGPVTLGGDGSLYFSDSVGTVYCVNAAGVQVWSLPGTGLSASPLTLAANGMLFGSTWGLFAIK